MQNIDSRCIILDFLTFLFNIICDKVMWNFSRFFQWIPNPFRNLRKHLNIEEEWQQFKHHMRPHKSKVYLGAIILSYPIYSEYVQKFYNWGKHQIAIKLNQLLQPERPPFQITDNFAKNLLGSIFSDENVKHEGLEFVNSIIQSEKFVDDILHLLVSALQNARFMQSLQGNAKELTIMLFDDKEVQNSIKSAVIQILSAQEVNERLIKLIQNTFTTQRSINTIVKLLQKSISNDEVKQALSGSINYAVQELLRDQEMMNQLKIFLFFLLRKFENDDEIKSMMNVLFAKGLGLTKKKKTNDLKKVLQTIDQKRYRQEPRQ